MLVESANQVLKKLKTILQSDLLVGKIHYIAMAVTVLMLSLFKWYFGFLFIPLVYLYRFIALNQGLDLDEKFELKEILIDSLEPDKPIKPSGGNFG